LLLFGLGLLLLAYAQLAASVVDLGVEALVVSGVVKGCHFGALGQQFRELLLLF